MRHSASSVRVADDIARVLVHIPDQGHVAHYLQGGGDPVQAIRRHGDRLLLLHIKDGEGPLPGATVDLARSYRFVELRRGRVDRKGVLAALDEVNFRGWAVVELEGTTESGRSAKDSAIIGKAFLEDCLRYRVSTGGRK